ncbi:PREDICTED: uncharacterized protein LOC104772628 [Camelina sativa]|uniref:Uncharacterized protein LOC104772628 n=1 Tax=Camelina sativa TaxID=90675 RepID=A0ABM0Y4U4_CAMSA|nr:PREDICTED: uncharacterized protein LOC104772628 [Camelina sativa]
MAAQAERAFGVTNIKSHIPLILDLDDHNYDAWRELFLTHCLTFDVLGHVDGSSAPANANDQTLLKRDGLVKLWIYGTLAQPLFKSSFKTGGTSRDIWLRIENQFRNNKDARVMKIDNDLRTMEIGDMSIQTYCQSLKSLADLLSNLDAPVNERNLVMYMLNGLNEKFDNIINSRLKKAHKTIASHTAHASSPTALVTTSNNSQNQQHQTQQRNNRPWRRNNRFNKGRNNSLQQNNLPLQQQRQQFPTWGSYWPNPYNLWQQPSFAPWAQYPPTVQNRGLLGPAPKPPNAHNAEAHTADLQPTRDFAEAFNTMTLAEPNGGDWYMDTGATTHLASSPGSSHSDSPAPQ